MKLVDHLSWLPTLTVALTTIALLARCLTLLIGLLATFSKIAIEDRGRAFGEFARAVGHQTRNVKPRSQMSSEHPSEP